MCRDQPKTLPKFTLEDVRKHSYDDDCWTVVDNKVYDITPFVSKHPGGTLIRQGYGRDSSPIFISSHPTRVRNYVLPKFLIGELVDDDKERFYIYSGEFYQVLRDRVDLYFKKKGISRHETPELLLKSVFILLLFFISYYFALVQGIFLFAFPLGFSLSQFGINIMHDGNHGSYSKYPLINNIMGSALNFIGGSNFVWKHEHNIGHHGNTNSDLDPDAITGPPFVRLSPHVPWKSYYQFQHFYVWFVYLGIGFRWFFGDFGFLFDSDRKVSYCFVSI